MVMYGSSTLGTKQSDIYFDNLKRIDMHQDCREYGKSILWHPLPYHSSKNHCSNECFLYDRLNSYLLFLIHRHTTRMDSLSLA